MTWAWMRAVLRWLRLAPSRDADALRTPTLVRRVPRSAHDRELAALRLTATQAEQRARWPQAIVAWSTVAERAPHDVAARLRLAELYFGLERPADAIAKLREALAILLRGDRPDEYLAVAQQVLRHEPVDRELTVAVVRLLVSRGERERASALLDRHFEARPPEAALVRSLMQIAQSAASSLILERAAHAGIAQSADRALVASCAQVLGRTVPPIEAAADAAPHVIDERVIEGDEPTARMERHALATLLVHSSLAPRPLLKPETADELTARGTDGPATRSLDSLSARTPIDVSARTPIDVSARPPIVQSGAELMSDLIDSLIRADAASARTRKVAPMVVDLVLAERSP